MVSVYGLEASQKCITPSACTVLAELPALAVSSTGPFSLLVALELPVSSKGKWQLSALPALWVGKLLSAWHWHRLLNTLLQLNQPGWKSGGGGAGGSVELLLHVRTWGWAEQGPQGLRVPVGCSLWAHLEAHKLGKSAPRCLRSCRCSVCHAKFASARRAAGQAPYGTCFCWHDKENGSCSPGPV